VAATRVGDREVESATLAAESARKRNSRDLAHELIDSGAC
jgi:hypothetical protein